MRIPFPKRRDLRALQALLAVALLSAAARPARAQFESNDFTLFGDANSKLTGKWLGVYTPADKTQPRSGTISVLAGATELFRSSAKVREGLPEATYVTELKFTLTTKSGLTVDVASGAAVTLKVGSPITFAPCTLTLPYKSWTGGAVSLKVAKLQLNKDGCVVTLDAAAPGLFDMALPEMRIKGARLTGLQAPNAAKTGVDILTDTTAAEIHTPVPGLLTMDAYPLRFKPAGLAITGPTTATLASAALAASPQSVRLLSPNCMEARVTAATLAVNGARATVTTTSSLVVATHYDPASGALVQNQVAGDQPIQVNDRRTFAFRDFTLEAASYLLDTSDKTGDPREIDAAGAPMPAAWRGVYVLSGRLRMPAKMKEYITFLNDDDSVPVTGFYVDDSGLHGRVKAEDLAAITHIGGFPIQGGFTGRAITVRNTVVVDGTLQATIRFQGAGDMTANFDFNQPGPPYVNAGSLLEATGLGLGFRISRATIAGGKLTASGGVTFTRPIRMARGSSLTLDLSKGSALPFTDLVFAPDGSISKGGSTTVALLGSAQIGVPFSKWDAQQDTPTIPFINLYLTGLTLDGSRGVGSRLVTLAGGAHIGGIPISHGRSKTGGGTAGGGFEIDMSVSEDAGGNPYLGDRWGFYMDATMHGVGAFKGGLEFNAADAAKYNAPFILKGTVALQVFKKGTDNGPGLGCDFLLVPRPPVAWYANITVPTKIQLGPLPAKITEIRGGVGRGVRWARRVTTNANGLPQITYDTPEIDPNRGASPQVLLNAGVTVASQDEQTVQIYGDMRLQLPKLIASIHGKSTLFGLMKVAEADVTLDWRKIDDPVLTGWVEVKSLAGMLPDMLDVGKTDVWCKISKSELRLDIGWPPAENGIALDLMGMGVRGGLRIDANQKTIEVGFGKSVTAVGGRVSGKFQGTVTIKPSSGATRPWKSIDNWTIAGDLEAKGKVDFEIARAEAEAKVAATLSTSPLGMSLSGTFEGCIDTVMGDVDVSADFKGRFEKGKFTIQKLDVFR